jgi:hypothetical protein
VVVCVPELDVDPNDPDDDVEDDADGAEVLELRPADA